MNGNTESQKPSARIDNNSVKPIYYVDAVFDFNRWQWFTGNGLKTICKPRTGRKKSVPQNPDHGPDQENPNRGPDRKIRSFLTLIRES